MIQQQKSKLLKIAFIFTGIALLLLLFLLNVLIHSKSQELLLRYFETKSLSKLDIYHEGIKKFAQDKINDKKTIVETIASSSRFLGYLQKKDTESVFEVLEQYGNASAFDNTLVLDEKGDLISIAGPSPEKIKTISSHNYAYRDYFKMAVETEKSYISDVFLATGDYYVVAFSAPVVVDGKVKYVVVGSNKLESIINEFNFKSNFDKFTTLLIDRQGRMITDGKKYTYEKQKIVQKDKFILQFVKNPKERFGEVIGINGDRYFVKGSIIGIDENNSLYLISYLPLKSYKEEVGGMIDILNRVILTVSALSLAVFLCCWFLSYRIFYRNCRYFDDKN